MEYRLLFLLLVGVPEKPGAPTFTEIMDTTVVLHWAAPLDDGGFPITNYLINCRIVNSKDWHAATNDKVSTTSHKIFNLVKDKKYEFKVAGQNKIGTGPFSDPSTPVLIKEGNVNS